MNCLSLLLYWITKGLPKSLFFCLPMEKDSVQKFHLLAKRSLRASWWIGRSCKESFLNSYLNCNGHPLSSANEGGQNATVLCSGTQALLALTGCQNKKSSEEKRFQNISFLKHKSFYFLENVIWNCQQFTSGILLICSRTFLIGFKRSIL